MLCEKYQYEEQLWSEGFRLVMGLDEVGRGCLAGPVVAGGVILKPGHLIEGIQDSKKINETERERLAEIIRKEALLWIVQEGSVEEITQHNILWASLLTMQKCIDNAEETPEYLLIDGNRFLDSLIPYQCLVKGDDRSASIGAASIIAKVHRDHLMRNLHSKYPYYGWDKNVGYPTKVHYAGLEKFGITEHHRQTFNLRTDKIFTPPDCDSDNMADLFES